MRRGNTLLQNVKRNPQFLVVTFQFVLYDRCRGCSRLGQLDRARGPDPLHPETEQQNERGNGSKKRRPVAGGHFGLDNGDQFKLPSINLCSSVRCGVCVGVGLGVGSGAIGAACAGIGVEASNGLSS